eukprot:Lithocolla_globosa_v1_NODE_67_length_7144_cov_10.886601.p4 type:complete len:130 gc:universal NODE_67_length_7144_cov_10.886601:1457-1846(+)
MCQLFLDYWVMYNFGQIISCRLTFLHITVHHRRQFFKAETSSFRNSLGSISCKEITKGIVARAHHHFQVSNCAILNFVRINFVKYFGVIILAQLLIQTKHNIQIVLCFGFQTQVFIVFKQRIYLIKKFS